MPRFEGEVVVLIIVVDESRFFWSHGLELGVCRIGPCVAEQQAFLLDGEDRGPNVFTQLERVAEIRTRARGQKRVAFTSDGDLVLVGVRAPYHDMNVNLGGVQHVHAPGGEILRSPSLRAASHEPSKTKREWRRCHGVSERETDRVLVV